MPTFVGRASELELLRARLAKAEAGIPQAVVVEGMPGVGKTSLVRAFLNGLDAESVWSASGDDVETSLRFGVLQQLMGTPGRSWVDPFTAGADLLGRLDDRPGRAPTVFVVDDVHLADEESMAALTFALRRLRADRVMAVVTTRSEDSWRLPSGLLKLVDGLDGRVRLEGLTDDDVIAFGSTLGHGQLSPRSASRLRRHTGGNPLYLRSLMSELSTEVLEAPGSLPAPQSYALLVLSSVASQSEQARRLARSAAVLADGTPFSLVAALAEVDEPEEALEELTRAQVLTCAQTDEGWRISFAHPLVRAAVYDDLGPLERQKAHQRAAVLCEDDQALFHRLAASSGPDPELAAELAARAGQLHESGDLRQAADYYLKAGHVGGRAGWPWLMDAATLFLIAGDVTAAKEAEESIAEDVGGAVRVYLQARIAWFGGQPSAAAELATQAWERADELDTRGRGELAAILAQLYNMQADGLGAADWATRALAEDLPPDLADSTVAAGAVGLVIAGQPEAALDALAALPPAPEAVGPEGQHQLTARGAVRALVDDLDGACHDLTVMCRSSASEVAPQRLLGMGVLAEVEYRLGRWDSSLTTAEQAISLAEDSEQLWVQGYLHAVAVLVCAGRGWWPRAEEHLADGRLIAEQLGDPATWAVCENLGVHVAWCRREPEEVVARSQLLLSLSGPTDEPGWLNWPVQYTSALVQLGRLEEAEAELDRLGAIAAARGSRSRLAALARVGGELATARREHTRARASFDEALRLDDAADALEQGLIRASYGRLLRRRGERRAARAHLEDASDRFRALGATPFVDACAEELGANGVPSDSSTPSEVDGLTPQEQIVVSLVCEGMTNQQVARQLVLSVKTIGYHLGNAYAKLGVHTRTQLVARLAPTLKE